MKKIAIIGFGVVGSGVYEVLKQNRAAIARRVGEEIEVGAIVDIRDLADHEAASLVTADFDAVLRDDAISIVVETMGGVKFAYDYTKAALEHGKSVITSNKELVARHGAEFFLLAQKHGVRYLYEASVGGGIPVVRPMAHCLAGNEISDIVGILNGTTNYILTKMFRCGDSFENALREAQELGYAEKDPTADVDGHDTCRKIAILTSLALGSRIDSDALLCEGIQEITETDVIYAAKMGCAIKLVGCAHLENGRATAFVGPMMIPKEVQLAGIEDVFNAVQLVGNAVDVVTLCGRGAGKLPTASAVVGDIIDAVRQPHYTPEFSWTDEDGALLPQSEVESVYFVRMEKEHLPEAEACFGPVVQMAGECDGAFLTPKMKEGLLDEKMASLHGVIKKIRLYQS